MTFPVNGPSSGSAARLPEAASRTAGAAAAATSSSTPPAAVSTAQAPDLSLGGVVTKNGLPASVLPMHAASPEGLKKTAEAITNVRKQLPPESVQAFDRFIKAKIHSLSGTEQNSAVAKSSFLPKLAALSASCLPSTREDSASQLLSEKTGRRVSLGEALTSHEAMTQAGKHLAQLLGQIHQANRDTKSQAASFPLNNKEGEKMASSAGNTPADPHTEGGSPRSGLLHSLENLLRTQRDLSSDMPLHVPEQTGNGAGEGSQHGQHEEEEEEEEHKKVEKAEGEFSPYTVMTDAFLRTLEDAASQPSSRPLAEKADASSHKKASELPSIPSSSYVTGLNPYIYLEDSYNIVALLLSALLDFVTITGNALTTLYNQYDYEAKNLQVLQKTISYLANYMASVTGNPDVNIDLLFPEPPVFLDTPIQCTDCHQTITNSAGEPVGELFNYKNLGINYGKAPSDPNYIVKEKLFFAYPNYSNDPPAGFPPLDLTRPPGVGLSVFDLFIYYKVIVDTGSPSTNKDFSDFQPFGNVEALLNAGNAAIQSRQNDINILSQHTSTLLKNRTSAIQALARVNNKLLESIRSIIRNI